jgi:hypothetical protein
MTGARIRTYYDGMFDQGAALAADWDRTRFQTEEPGAEPSARAACSDEMPDATGPVMKIRLWLRELVPNRASAIGCPQLEGVYLLRMRQTPGGWRICHETWSLREGVCYSCPTAPTCARVAAP